MAKSLMHEKLKRTYEKGLALYQKGKFTDAKKVFDKITIDPAAVMMIERIQLLRKNKPNEWNGVWRWEEK